ncbi:MAG: hypothetical protein GF331_06905 [Chitinivibrionales bacterium]|nr:hypothetical protein [Chitinivibrionales bacterium]
MRKVLVTTLLLAVSRICAQDSAAVSAETAYAFDLATYRPPSYVYHALTLEPRLSMDGRWGEDASDSDDSHTRSALGASGRLRLFWTLDKYRQSHDMYNRLSVHGDCDVVPLYSTEDNTDAVPLVSYTEKAADGWVGVNSYHRWGFYSRKLWYLEATISPDVSWAPRRTEEVLIDIGPVPPDNDTAEIRVWRDDVRETKTVIRGRVAVGAGWGRLHDISNADVALHMLDRARATGHMSGAPSAARIRDLADKVHSQRHRRKLDARIGRIEDIDAICAHMLKTGIVDSLSPRLAMEMLDMWQYAGYPRRYSGLNAGLSPFATLRYESRKGQREEYRAVESVPYHDGMTLEDFGELPDADSLADESKVDDGESELDYGLTLQARYERPWRRFFQLSAQGEVTGAYRREERSFAGTAPPEHDDAGLRLEQTWVSARGTVDLGWYPDTRTEVRVGLRLDYHREYDYHEVTCVYGYCLNHKRPHIDVRELTGSLHASLEYYLSPRFRYRLWGSVSLSDLYDSYESPAPSLEAQTTARTSFGYGLGGSLTYHIR